MHAEVLGLCSCSLLLPEMSFRIECGVILEGFSAHFSLPVLKADRAEFGKLVGAATNQLMTQCQKGNSNHCVNMSASELTLTILGIAQIFGTTRHGEYWKGMFVSAVVRFALDTSSLLALCPG